MPTREEARQRYWKSTLAWLVCLLAIWFICSLGCGVLFVDQLDAVKLPGTGFNLGFWFAQQGSIMIFLALVAAYVVIMNKLDARLSREIAAAGEEDR